MNTIEKAANTVIAVAVACIVVKVADTMGCFKPIKKKWAEIKAHAEAQ